MFEHGEATSLYYGNKMNHEAVYKTNRLSGTLSITMNYKEVQSNLLAPTLQHQVSICTLRNTLSLITSRQLR